MTFVCVGFGLSTFVWAKSSKTQAPQPEARWLTVTFFVPSGDIFDDRLVTLFAAAWSYVVHFW